MSMDREVGGVKCSEVLVRLTDFLEGDLQGEELRTVQAHLAGCDACTRFGARFARAVEALRALPPPEALPDAVARRLEGVLKAQAR